jgi:DNA polymerase III subunit gamma/tau
MNERSDMVFYRKYRPQKISELDNEAVRENLTSIFSKENSIHAFLFTGSKGLGKTSAARIIAKVINCVGRKDKTQIEPCNKCEQCVSITNGNNLDVLEIDGASNRGIDEIRDLREKIKLAPFKASKKIYIIDEVHMLTTEAFNALLKTLEEPPGHAVFILCTTETSKIPATIASRCFRINFNKPTNEEYLRSLSRVIKEEDIKIDKDAMLEIASLSDGSFRDGVKILEEVVGFAGRKTITKELINEKYNALGIGDNVLEMLKVLSAKDVRAGIKLCQKLEKQGMDFKFFIEKLIERLHLLLLIEAGVEKGEAIFSLNEIRKLFELLSTAYSETKFAVLPQTPLELVVIEWGEEGKNEALRSQSGLDESSNASVPAADEFHSSSGYVPPKRDLAKTSSQQIAPRANKQVGEVDPSTRITFSNDDSFFAKLIDAVKVHNNLFAGVLRGCKAQDIKDGVLVIQASSKFHKEKIEEAKNIKLLEDEAKKISGDFVKISVVLK